MLNLRLGFYVYLVDELNFEWSLSIKVITSIPICVIGQWLLFMIILYLLLYLGKLYFVQGTLYSNGVKDTDFGNKVSPKSVTSTKIYAKSVCFTLIY